MREKPYVYKILYYKVYRHSHTFFWVLLYVQNKKRNCKWTKESIQKPHEELEVCKQEQTLMLPPSTPSRLPLYKHRPISCTRAVGGQLPVPCHQVTHDGFWPVGGKQQALGGS